MCRYVVDDATEGLETVTFTSADGSLKANRHGAAAQGRKRCLELLKREIVGDPA